MYLLDERIAVSLVSMEEAIEVVAAAFAALDGGDAALFPVVMGTAGEAGEVVGIKGGRIDWPGRAIVGVKIGSYWPGNRASAEPAHGSTTLLLDSVTGFPHALVAASALNSLRTAASDGVAIRALSRPDSYRLAVIGAGHQAWYEMRAACTVRPIRTVRIWNRSPAAAEALARRARDELGVDAVACGAEDAVRDADIVVTVTAAVAPLVEAAWIAPGAHVSAMGADVAGKQELPVALAARARCFADVVVQAITVGELQAAHRAGLLAADEVTPIGAVLAGRLPGRIAAEDVTLYDSSGTALQDLAIADLALRRAIEQRIAGAAGPFHPVA